MENGLGCFDVRFSPDMSKVGKFAKMCVDEYAVLFDTSLWMQPNVFLMYSRKEIDYLYGKKAEPWIIGFSRQDNIYVLHWTLFASQSSHKEKEFEDFVLLIRHELFHLYANLYLRGNYPEWLREGTACYFAGQVKMKLDKEQMLLLFDSEAKVNSYILGENWIRMLVNKFGQQKMIDFIKSFGGKKYSLPLFRQNFKKAFGVVFSRKEFEKLLQN